MNPTLDKKKQIRKERERKDLKDRFLSKFDDLADQEYDKKRETYALRSIHKK